uniref:Protein tyrosine phosphatase receptor type Nb n=1 Tax=Lates calcarifer TaxID=8187 RepID=A0A4W6ETZ5_LATCA
MRSPRLWAALCLLLTASCRLCAAARYGCLFEKKLCPRDQLCNDDGLFGQCQAPHQEPVQYQVSVPALHKLQEVLKDLMVQGLTWRDDVTQAIISRELSKIPTVGASSELHEKTVCLSLFMCVHVCVCVFVCVLCRHSPLGLNDGVRLLELLSERIGLSTGSFISISVVGPAVTFRIRPNSKNLTAGDVAKTAEKNFLESETGLKVLQSGVGERCPWPTRVQPGSRWVFATLVAMACIGGILVAAMTIACLRHHAHRLAAKKLGLGPEGGSFSHQEYQDLCRQHMASKGAFGRLEAAALDSRVSSVSSQFSDGAQPSPSSHSSTPSWCEEPAQANMDISTGHMILAYMEDHLRNKDRLMKEWEALCSYQAEPSAVSVAQSDANAKKNRCPDSVPYDHSRVKLKAEINPSRSDYINASTIVSPRLSNGHHGPFLTSFWFDVVDGEKQCDRYWPDEGSSLYHIYEVNLVSEHIWCNDFLVRSFYLKNVQTQETRTLTQFHFLSWPAQGIPTSTRPLLDFRRKVNKCYRGRSCPIIVHCSDGTGRTGTYILIDMVLNRMAKGVKEIDIAATLEHVRDQRPGMVRTKDQFEFALTAVAEEVNAILKALPQ